MFSETENRVLNKLVVYFVCFICTIRWNYCYTFLNVCYFICWCLRALFFIVRNKNLPICLLWLVLFPCFSSYSICVLPVNTIVHYFHVKTLHPPNRVRTEFHFSHCVEILVYFILKLCLVYSSLWDFVEFCIFKFSYCFLSLRKMSNFCLLSTL